MSSIRADSQGAAAIETASAVKGEEDRRDGMAGSRSQVIRSDRARMEAGDQVGRGVDAVLGTRGRWLGDLAAVTVYLSVAIFVTVQLWASPGRYTVRGQGGVDLYFFEFAMAHGARVVTDLQNPFFTDRLNVPDGINMMGNTSVLGLSMPLTPVTVLFGPHISVLVALVICLAATAAAWYFVLSRHLVSSRLGAFTAGALCGFAPAMMSQAVGHLNFVAQFLIPIIAWRVMKLAEPGRVLRNGLVLGLLVAWQAFLNEEFLIFTAIGCFFFVGTWALARRSEARARAKTFLASLGVATVVGCVALAYPLYVQFFGPQSYKSLPFNPAKFYADVYSYFLFSSESFAGDRAKAALYAPNRSEENTFLGWPLMSLVIIISVWLWRNVVARAVLVVALVFGAISLGNEIMIARRGTGIPGPYKWLSHLPLTDLSIPSRYALIVVPMVAVLLALATDRITAKGIGALKPTGGLTIGWYALLAAVLLPIAPTPLAVVPVPDPPRFITSGAWKQYVAEGRSLVTVPISNGTAWGIAPLRWSSVTGMDFVAPGGYFIGPAGPDQKQARFNSGTRPTSTLLDTVARRGYRLEAIGEKHRTEAIEDLRFWRASVVVLAEHPHEEVLRQTLEDLLGPGDQVDDVWLWDVRALRS